MNKKKMNKKKVELFSLRTPQAALGLPLAEHEDESVSFSAVRSDNDSVAKRDGRHEGMAHGEKRLFQNVPRDRWDVEKKKKKKKRCMGEKQSED
jgi:hypothetical protein